MGKCRGEELSDCLGNVFGGRLCFSGSLESESNPDVELFADEGSTESFVKVNSNDVSNLLVHAESYLLLKYLKSPRNWPLPAKLWIAALS